MSPTMGKREDVPSILLGEAFTVDNENSYLRYGEIHRAKMRLKELLSSPTETTVDVESASAQPVLSVAATTLFLVGEEVLVDEGESHERTYTILSVQADVSLTMTENLEYTHEVAETVTQAGLNKIRTPDTNPVLFYHRFVKRITGTEYLLLFTKAHIYHWNDTTKTLDLKFTCSSDCDNWKVVTYNGEVVATNNVDKVLHSDMSGNFTPLDTASGIEYSEGVYLTKAEYLISFENFLILGYTTENAQVYPQRIRWSSLGDAGTGKWKVGNAGSLEIGKDDFLIGFGKYLSYLIVFKTESHYKMWLVPTSAVFEVEPLSDSIGCKASGSIINDKYGRLFYLASDYTFREIKEGEISAPIDPTIRTITPTYVHLVKSAYIDKYNHILWSINYSSPTNNKVLVLKDGKWGQFDLAISAFGNYERQTGYAWDTLGYSTWDSWGWDKWDAQEPDIGFKINLAADYNGYTYNLYANEKDDGEDYSGYFVLSTDLMKKKGLSFYKRILDLYLYVRKETAGTLTVEIKRDHEMSWQSVGEISLTGNEDILVKHLASKLRAKHFLVKIGGGNRFRFIGIMFKFVPAGER